MKKHKHDGVEPGAMVLCDHCKKKLTRLVANVFGPPDAICDGCCDEATESFLMDGGR